jgi:hypothetical protein
MERALTHRWWLLAIRGLCGIAFGVLTFVAPLSGLFALAILFGAYALVAFPPSACVSRSRGGPNQRAAQSAGAGLGCGCERASLSSPSAQAKGKGRKGKAAVHRNRFDPSPLSRPLVYGVDEP